ncbi:LuxR C-terminal-related transcriptional regulator [uncultured Ruthenibacterium sp.]|uniref:LuxR C-terminal-related transcriptional regulator n=1 Tax=uncultured Ruthenibacterium sp. TaxID=1905347 RepID=UPI00349E62F1
MADSQFEWGPVEEQIEREDWNAAAALLEQIDVQRLPVQEKIYASAAMEKLPEEVRRRPLLCVRRIELAVDRGDMDEAKRGFVVLSSLRERSRENTPERQRIESLLGAVSLMKKGTDNAQILLTLSVLYNEMVTPQVTFSATGGRPSVLNGAKDLSQWGRNWKAVRSIVRPMLGALLEKEGLGASEAACAELLYLKNDLNNAALQLAAAKSAPDPEICFAGLCLTVRLHLLDPASKQPEELVERMLRTLEEKKATWLIPNAHAFQTRLFMRRGRLEEVEQWLTRYDSAEFDRCCPENAYVLQTKAQAYLALGRYREAAMLTEDLLLMIQKDCRTIDRVEYLLDGALACERMGDGSTALDKVYQALDLAQPYGYVRLFADRGAPMLALVNRCIRERTSSEEQMAFWRKASEAAKQLSLLCPALYAPVEKTVNIPQLTQTEVEVLHLLAAGKTNRDICEALGIKLPTAKFHIHNLCEKLGAGNRTGALSEAKKRGIL